MSDNNYPNYQENTDVQAAVSAALADEKKKKKKKRLIIFTVIVVIIIAIIAIGGGSGNDTPKDPSNSSNNSEINAKPNEKAENVIGDFKCVVKGAKLTKDYSGKDAVIITYDFTNNSNNPISFDVALDDNLYQDGVGLETAILDEDTDILDVEIKPGVTKEVKKAYVLRDKTTDIDVEISELFSFNDDKLTTTVKIK